MLKFHLLTTLALLCPLAARADELTLRIENIPSDAAGEELARALAKVPGVKLPGKISKDQPTARVVFDPAKADVGDLAKAVADARAGTRVKPVTRLVLGCQRFDDSLIEDNAFLPRYVEANLAKLKDKGVDVKDWKLDAKNREVHIRLDDKGSAKLADIKAAFPSEEAEAFALIAYVVK